MPFGVRTFLEGFTSAAALACASQDTAFGRASRRVGSGSMRFGIFYEHQLPAARGTTDAEQRLLAGRARAGRARRPARHRLRLGGRAPLPRGVLALLARPRCSSPPPASGPSDIRLGHGIVADPARATTTRRASPSASRRSTSSRAAASSSAPASRRSAGRARRLRRRPRDQARAVGGGARRRSRGCSSRSRSPATTARFVTMPPRNVVPKPVQKPHPPLWVACSPPRDDPPRRRARASARCRSRSSSPRRRSEWVDEYYEHHRVGATACRPASPSTRTSPCVLPMMCHDDEATAIERGIDGAHFFGYSLAHYYVFGDHRPGRTNVWEEFLRAARESGFAREIVIADDGAARRARSCSRGSARCAARSARPSRSRDLVRRYEEAGVDQVIFVSRRARTGTSTSASRSSCSPPRCCPSSPTRREEREAAKRERLAAAVERGAGAARAGARRRTPAT